MTSLLIVEAGITLLALAFSLFWPQLGALQFAAIERQFDRLARRTVRVPPKELTAAAAALGDDEHVDAQRARYLERLEFLAEVLSSAGCPAHLPDGGFYLWVASPERLGDGWALTEELARTGGILVSPGEFYGPEGANFVRVAAVQPMERLALFADRMKAAGRLGD